MLKTIDVLDTRFRLAVCLAILLIPFWPHPKRYHFASAAKRLNFCFAPEPTRDFICQTTRFGAQWKNSLICLCVQYCLCEHYPSLSSRLSEKFSWNLLYFASVNVAYDHNSLKTKSTHQASSSLSSTTTGCS